jgi:hypothetical protein
MKHCLGCLLIAMLVAVLGSSAASAGSQCFKNLDDRDLYVSLRYADGRTVELKLKAGEKRRFDDVKDGDHYCYSFSPISKECEYRSPVYLTSCSDPRLTN